MADRRYLAQSITDSGQVAALVERCGPWAALLFTWAIAHIDDDSRLVGDPETLRHKILGRYLEYVSGADVTEMLATMNDLDLGSWYEVLGSPGERYLYFPKFSLHQTLRTDRYGPSRFPAPPAWQPDAAHPYTKNPNLEKEKPQRDRRRTARVPRRKLDVGRLVYFIGDLLGGPVKIGVSLVPEQRLASLQTSYPYRLQLLATSKGDAPEEFALHQRFAHLRLEGEWFRRGPELVDHIAGLAAAVRTEELWVSAPTGQPPADALATERQPDGPERLRNGDEAPRHPTSPHLTPRHPSAEPRDRAPLSQGAVAVAQDALSRRDDAGVAARDPAAYGRALGERKREHQDADVAALLQAAEPPWRDVLSELAVSLPKTNFATWFKGTELVLGPDGEAIVYAPNAFARDWLRDRYVGQIRAEIQRVVGHGITALRVEVEQESA